MKRRYPFLVPLSVALSLTLMGLLTNCSSSPKAEEDPVVSASGDEAEVSDGQDFRPTIRQEIKNYATFSMQTLSGFPIQFRSGIKAVVAGGNNKKVTANTLKVCNTFQKTMPQKFPELVRKIGECKQSGGLCDPKMKLGCVTDFAADVLFKSPQTVSVLTKVFVPKGPAGSEKELCQAWVKKQELAFGSAFVFGQCNYDYQFDQDARVTAEVYAIPTMPALEKGNLEEHNMALAMARNTRFYMRMKDRESISIGYVDRQGQAARIQEKTEERAKLECSAVRAEALKKLPTTIKSVTECVPEKISCTDQTPPLCNFAYSVQIQLKQPAMVYSLAREFRSKGGAEKGLAECHAWLNAEKKFAAENYLGGSCSIGEVSGSPGAETVSIEGEIREIDTI